MSFLGDVLGSIGTGHSPAPPKLPQRPASTNTVPLRSEPAKSAPKAALNGAPTPQNGTKRKAEDDLRALPEKVAKPSNTTILTNIKPRPGPSSAPALAASTKVKTPTVPGGIATPPAPPPKAPAKGSYADIMARARAAQEKNSNQVGMIKHQAASKEKVSKVAQKRREEEQKAQSHKGKHKRPGDNGRIEKRRSVSPVKKREEPKVAKTPRPPLSAPPGSTSASTSTYKGTMGLPGRRPPPTAANNRDKLGKKPSKYDDYLGTDEEDEGDDIEDEGGYDSEGSSDMEAGAFDIDEEENLALKHAKQDDAKELAHENQLKREKEERRKKLQAMADRRR